MLHKCANPACSNLFLSLSLGKLFLLDTEDSALAGPRSGRAIRRGRSLRRLDRYWLCDACCAVLTLTFERGRGMITVPLPARNTFPLTAHLTQTQPIVKVCRAELKGAL